MSSHAPRGGGPGALVPEGAEPGRPEEPRDFTDLKKRGIELATLGLLMALGLLLAQDAYGVVDLATDDLVAAAGVTLLVQGALWLIPHLGWDDRLAFDDRYLLLPVAAASVLLAYFTWLAPSTSHLHLLGWFVALLFMAGLARMREVVALATLMAGAQLVALTLARGGARPATAELIQAGVFLAVGAYAGVIFEHLRDEREERKELRKRLADEARTDYLTGLLNRRGFDRELRAELSRVDRYGVQGAMALVDLDHFKHYNDAHGHPAGDETLKEVARVLQTESRTSDKVARYGGEEFAVIMPEISAPDALSAAERLRSLLEDHRFEGEDALPSGALTVSVGLASYPEDGTNFEKVLGVADRRLYRAKDRGRNRVCAAG